MNCPTETDSAFQSFPPRDFEIIDSHHHLWDLKANHYPWLATDQIQTRVCGDYSALRRDYLLEDFLADIGSLNVVSSVHIQAEHDPSDPVRETRWLQGVADRPGGPGFPHAIVAFADLGADTLREVLDGHAQAPNLRGIRQILYHADGDPLTDEGWLRNVALLSEFGLHFELQAYPDRARDAAALIDRYPNMQFVIPHCGLPARTDADGVRQWRDSIRLYAERPNVVMKLSGFGMFDRNWTSTSIAPVFHAIVEAFGVGRAMFGSNFPVDGLARDYAFVWSSFWAATAGFSLDERKQLFHDTAARVYRLQR